MTVVVRSASAADRSFVVDIARARLGDERQVHTRRQFDVRDGDVLIAVLDGTRAGFASWDHADHTAELLAIAARVDRRGVGHAFVATVRARARRDGCTRLLVVTTDENVGAQRFYAALGFALVDRRIGAVDECRQRYKPSIPAGIHDELEYAIDLNDDPTEEAS